MTTITYGNHTLDFATLPEASLVAMLKRGVTHYLGNEQAAKVSGYKDSNPDATDDAIAAFKAECQSKAVAALQAGTVGHTVRGPRVEPVEAAMSKIARTEIEAILKKNGIAFPKGEATITVARPNGASDAYTGVQLVSNWLSGMDKLGVYGKPGEHNEPRIRKEAERRLAEAKRKADRAAASESATLADVM